MAYLLEHGEASSAERIDLTDPASESTVLRALACKLPSHSDKTAPHLMRLPQKMQKPGFERFIAVCNECVSTLTWYTVYFDVRIINQADLYPWSSRFVGMTPTSGPRVIEGNLGAKITLYYEDVRPLARATSGAGRK